LAQQSNAGAATERESQNLLAVGATALGITLHATQREQFSALARELIDGSVRANLTSITDPDEIEVLHFVDSLTPVPLLRAYLGTSGGTLVDVGAGAGLPGLALAIVLPQHDVTLVEATAKKARFISHAIDVLRLANARVVAGRAEDVARLPEHRERFDVAIARAVGSVAALVELLVPLVRVGGRAVLMKTRAQAEVEVEEAARSLGELHGRVERVADVALPGLLNDRALVVVRKDEATPERYPRRAGVPQRRPIGRF
jgi:16S rRNA (guanine527-N7)-methyltransferase